VVPQQLIHPEGAITFKDVLFQYEKGGQVVLRDFNVDIKPGESIAFVGYSGAGKTTIAKLLMRMYDPTEGTVQLDGVDVRELRKAELRNLIGIVPQDPLLFNNTIYYNIAYARDGATRSEVMAAASAAKVDEFVKQLPKGYDTVVGERGIKLSGGQRQRLAIARILLEQPQVIILDEATSALDSASEQTIQAAFWELVRNPERPLTSIIIAHRLSTIMRADRIVVMDKGAIVEIGSHDELIKNEAGIYYKLWSLQRNGFIADGETSEA
jgi:ATP-binding cassette subfamily B protein